MKKNEIFGMSLFYMEFVYNFKRKNIYLCFIIML